MAGVARLGMLHICSCSVLDSSNEHGCDDHHVRLPLTLLTSLVAPATAPRTSLTTIPIHSMDRRKPPSRYTVALSS